jgi:acetyltransferase-like isoleucine patch superfamily enzyme
VREWADLAGWAPSGRIRRPLEGEGRAPRPVSTEAKVTRRFDAIRWPFGQAMARLRSKIMMIVPNDHRVELLRKQGVRIGENCIVYTTLFSTEPYLVEIGDHCAVSSGTSFITHDATGWLFEDHPNMDVFGRIEVGHHTYFGTNCTVLPGTKIGPNCVIGSGSVLRGEIPEGSVVFGNPARVVMKTALLKELLVNHKHRLDTRQLPPKEKEKILRRHFGLTP